jgi:2-methylcitrate dehydratase PrpD
MVPILWEQAMTVASRFAEFLVGQHTTDLPQQALEHAAMMVASTIASAACGKNLESSRIIRDLAEERGGRPGATVWFTGPRLPIADTAQVNAVMSDAAASDDSDLRNIVHAGTPLTAVSLAIAEQRGLGGDAVLRAMVLGYEAAGRISAAMPRFRERGFHGCHGAIFAAAVASSMLLELDANQLAQAIALSATSIGGLVAAADTSVAREYHAGLASQLGVNAALAASRGYNCEARILEMRRGFFETIGGADGEEAGAEVLRGLGESWDIVTDMAIKLVPGGHPYHALAEAAASATRKGNIAAEEIASIIVSRPGMTALHGPLHPTNLIDMAHSPAYFTAAGAADGNFSWEHAGAAKIADPTIHRLIDLVCVGDPPEDDAALFRQGARVTIRTRDGREATSIVYVPKGAGALGIAWDDVDAKYRALVPLCGLPVQAVDESLAMIHAFRCVPDLKRLVGVLLVREPAK